MITERLMSNGTFDGLTLRADTPQRVIDRVKECANHWGTIIITAAPIDEDSLTGLLHDNHFEDTDQDQQIEYGEPDPLPDGQDHPLYQGVLHYVKPGNDGTHALSGPGLGFLLGDNSKGQLVYAKIPLGERFSGGLVPSPFLFEIIFDGETGGFDWSRSPIRARYLYTADDDAPKEIGDQQGYGFVSRTDLLTILRGFWGYEYRITSHGFADAGIAERLFPGRTVIARNTTDDPTHDTSQATSIEATVDTSDWVNGVYAIGPNNVTDLVADTTRPHYDPHGRLLEFTVTVEASDDADLQALNNTATGELATRTAQNRQVSISTRTHTVNGRLIVGQRLDIFDPPAGLIDPARSVWLGGEEIHPVDERLIGKTWPYQEGMGALASWYTPDGHQIETLDRWLVGEGGDTTLEIGKPDPVVVVKPKKTLLPPIDATDTGAIVPYKTYFGATRIPAKDYLGVEGP